MLFLPDEDKLAAEARSIIEDVVAAEGRCRIAGWRDVPVVKDVVGPLARENEPRIVQVQPRPLSVATVVPAASGPGKLQPRLACADA